MRRPAAGRGLLRDRWLACELCCPQEGGGSEANLDRCAQRFATWMREHGFAGS